MWPPSPGWSGTHGRSHSSSSRSQPQLGWLPVLPQFDEPAPTRRASSGLLGLAGAAIRPLLLALRRMKEAWRSIWIWLWLNPSDPRD